MVMDNPYFLLFACSQGMLGRESIVPSFGRKLCLENSLISSSCFSNSLNISTTTFLEEAQLFSPRSDNMLQIDLSTLVQIFFCLYIKRLFFLIRSSCVSQKFSEIQTLCNCLLLQLAPFIQTFRVGTRFSVQLSS